VIKSSPAAVSAVAVSFFAVLALSGCATSLTGNDPEARTPRQIIDDQDTEMVAKRLILASDPRFEEAHVIVVCYNGVVLLSGQVESDDLKAKAAGRLNGLDNVRSVHNELEVASTPSLPARIGDAWITTKVKSAMVSDPNVHAGRINVTTVDGVVYLMGDLTRQEADDAVAVTQTVSGPRKIVKAFEYVD